MDGGVLTLVITKLSDLLEQKVRLIAGAEDEIRSLRDDLNLLTISVIGMLMPKGGAEDDGLRVVSVIGMGGLGKSTLARKIFNSREIKMRFVTKVWVVVAEHVEAKHVLKNILLCLKVNIEKDDDDYLKENLKRRLVGGRYLIVLDDLWTPKQWEEIKSYLPTDQKRGSRILLTSRIENVANVASTASTTYHLNPLGDADSWSLFCKKALKGEKCPSNLEAIGKGIVSKCEGLPLAIIVLGSLLSAAEAEPSFKYWSKILGDTSWHPDLDNDCSRILSLSYRNLPTHLKTCFLYVGIFPEDFEILANDLCSLWVAEGFVSGQSRHLKEDDAEQYLINLADRNLIIISKRKSDGSIKSVRIHDLLRDLCVKEAEKCIMYEVNADGVSQNYKEGIPRLALHKSDRRTMLLPHLYPGLRTLLGFSYVSLSNMRSVFKDLCVVRVLRLQFDEHFGRFDLAQNTILLKYLKIYQEITFGGLLVIRTRDISNLSYLQVLNLRSQSLTHLPKGIWKLKLLRHIHVRDVAFMPDAQSSHDSLPCLQTLSCIIFSKHILRMLSNDRFPSLRKLFLVNSLVENPFAVESLQSLPKLLHFVALKISFRNMIERDSGSLKIDAFPSTITKIHLKNTALMPDHWKLLGKLKNLQVLKLSTRESHASSIEEGRFLNQPLVFETEAFPQLIYLKLGTRHQTLILEDGALRTLQYLIIHPWIECTLGLLKLPDQLWLSTTLRQVKVINPSAPLRNYNQSLEDSKRSKVTIS